MEDIIPQKPVELTQNQPTAAPPIPAVNIPVSTPPEPTMPEQPIALAPAVDPVTPAQSVPIPDQNTVETAAPMAVDAKKKRNPILLIVAIVSLVVIGLAMAAYLAFAKQDKAANTKTKAAQVSAPVVKDPSTSSEIIDQNLSKIDDSKDYSTASLSDSTLGL